MAGANGISGQLQMCQLECELRDANERRAVWLPSLPRQPATVIQDLSEEEEEEEAAGRAACTSLDFALGFMGY